MSKYYSGGTIRLGGSSSSLAGSRVELRQGDTLPALRMQLLDDVGEPIVIEATDTVLFSMGEAGTTPALVAECDVITAASGIVEYQWVEGDLETAGRFRGEVEIIKDDGQSRTIPPVPSQAVRIVVRESTFTRRTLSSLVVTPNPLSVQQANDEQLTVVGHFSDGITRTLTQYATYTATGCTITSDGLLTAGDTVGSFSVTVTFDSVSEIVPLTVTQRTQFYTDFSLGTIGDPLPDLARFVSYGAPEDNYQLIVRAVVGATGGNVLRSEGVGGASRSWVWNAVPQTTYHEIVGKFRATSLHSSNAGMGLMARMTVDATGSIFGGWGCRLYNNGGTRYFQLFSYQNAVFDGTPGAGVAAPEWTNNTWMWQRLRIEPSGIKARYWVDGQTEPSSWHVTSSHDPDLLSPGWVGVYVDEPAVTEELDIVSAAINGETAALTGTPYMGELDAPAVASSVYTFDFENDTDDLPPAGFTEAYNTANTSWTVVTDEGNKFVTSIKTGGATPGIFDVTAMSDASTVQEILAKVRQTSLASNGNGLALRVEADPTDSAYVCELTTGGMTISRWVSGTYTAVATTTFGTEAGRWYWMRFRADGTTLKGKIWRDDEPEPKVWLREGTDSNLTAGSAGLYHFSANGIDYDDISIATS